MRVGLLVENDATFVVDEARALRSQGIEVCVASVFRPDLRWSTRYGARVAYPDPGALGWARHLARGRGLHARAPALTARARAEGVPLRLVALSLGLAAAARRDGWDHVHGSFATLPAWVAGAVADLTGKRFSFTGHAYDVQQPRPFLPRLIREASFVRAISHETADRLRAADPGGASAVRVGHLGVDLSRVTPRARGPLPEILCVARLVPKKGIDTLLRSVASMRATSELAFRVRVLGDGPQRGALESLSRELGLAEVVHFEGDATPDEVREALSRAALFALPCRNAVPGPDHDGIPVAILEAMAASVPVVSTPVGGIPEAITPGVQGWLVPPDDERALAEACSALLARPALGARLATAARARIERHFQLSQSATRLARWMRDASHGDPLQSAEVAA